MSKIPSGINDFRSNVRQIFADYNFYVSNFYFEHIVQEDNFRDIIIKNFNTTEIAQILRYSPDFFVMHKKIEPEDGFFFVVCCPDQKNLGVKRFGILQKYYPFDQIALVSTYSSKKGETILSGQWLNELKKTSSNKYSLSEFIEKIVGVS